MGSMVDHSLDHDGVGILSSQWHIPAEIDPTTPSSSLNGSTHLTNCDSHIHSLLSRVAWGVKRGINEL